VFLSRTLPELAKGMSAELMLGDAKAISLFSLLIITRDIGERLDSRKLKKTYFHKNYSYFEVRK